MNEDGSCYVLIANRTLWPIKLKPEQRVAKILCANVCTTYIDEFDDRSTFQQLLPTKHETLEPPQITGVPSDIAKRANQMLADDLKGLWGNKVLLENPIGEANLTLTDPDAPGIIEPIRRRAPAQMKFIKEAVDALQELGIVEDGNLESQWCSEPVLAKAKESHGQYRFCIDYRKLNDRLVKQNYPLPRVNDMLEAMAGKKVFSKIDLTKAFYYIFLKENERDLTTFRANHEIKRFWRMPFGLKNGSITFQYFMDKVMGSAKYIIANNYLDDVIIFSDTLEQHLTDLRAVLTRFMDIGIVLNPEKCEFFKSNIEFLGYNLTSKGLGPTEEKLKKIREWVLPKSEQQLRSFLGFANYYHDLLKSFSRLAKPLFELLPYSKNPRKANVAWTPEGVEAFETLRTEMLENLGIYHRDPSLPLVLDTDASEAAIGAVISQITPDGEEQPIGFYSAILKKYQKNWHVSRKEAYGIVEGVKKFAHYVQGEHFLIRTDHKFLTNLRYEKKDILQRWALELEDLDYTIEYRKGDLQGNGDGMSRLDSEICLEAQVNLLEASNEVLLQKIAEATWKDELWATIRKVLNHELPYPGKGGYKGVWKKAIRAVKTHAFEIVTLSGFSDKSYMVRHEPDCGAEICLPHDLAMEVYNDIHKRYHEGMQKTTARFDREFFTFVPHQHLEKSIKFCSVCADAKPKVNLATGAGSFDATEPLQFVGIDWADLPESCLDESGRQAQGELAKCMKSCLVIRDHFSNYIWAVPTATKTQSQAITILSRIFKESFPKTLVVDAALAGSEIQQWALENGVTLHQCAPHKHSGNPVAERAVRTLKEGLSIRILAHGRDRKLWPTFCQEVCDTNNSGVSTVNGTSPNQLMGAGKRDFALSHSLLPEGYGKVTDRTEQNEIAQKRRLNLRKHNKRLPEAIRVGDQVVIKMGRSKFDAPMNKIRVRPALSWTCIKVLANGLKLLLRNDIGKTCQRHIDHCQKVLSH